VSLTGIEVISQTTVATTFLNGQLNGSETVTGTTGDLTVTGTAVNDTIDLSGFTNGLTQGTNASGGFLKASGAAGSDTITGGSGNEVLVGGAAGDTITAGGGTDYVTGGSGADTINLTETTSVADYVVVTAVTDGTADGVAGTTFSGHDTITGFTTGTDVIMGDTNNAYTTTTIGTALFTDASAKAVMAGTAATNAASDLTAADATNVDKVVAFLADAGVVTAHGYTNADVSALAITFTDQTFLYAVESANATFTADEVNLLAVIDEVLVAGDILTA
jgi:hypothetical protein